MNGTHAAILSNTEPLSLESLRRSYCAAWHWAEFLQSIWEGDCVLFGVIYDRYQCRWIVNCVDASQWITKRSHGGHRVYYPEVWSDE